MIIKGIFMFIIGAIITLVLSALVRESKMIVMVVSYIMGWLVCLVYGLTTRRGP